MAPIPRNSPDLTDKAAFREIADIALDATRADHLFIALSDQAGGTTRFANSQITQNVNTRERTLTIEAAFGNRHGSAATNDFSSAGVKEAVARAEAIAEVTPENDEYLPPIEQPLYPILPTFRPETASLGPTELAQRAGVAIDLCADAGLSAAGIVEAYTQAAGVAASSGLFGHETRTRIRFSVTATGAGSSGSAANEDRSSDALDVETLTRFAVRKAQLSANPRELPARPMTAILEPSAMASFVAPLFWTLGARAVERGASAYAGKLGQRVIDERLTLQNRPDHPALLGAGFSEEGLPTDYHKWFDRGVLQRVMHDRWTAKQAGVTPAIRPDAIVLSANDDDNATAATVEELVAQTDFGVLVTTFWYIRMVNPQDLTLTGMTRDGVLTIENGAITGAAKNFRWHESPLAALNRLEGYTAPMNALNRGHKMMLPVLKLADFGFSSATRF
ncbi:MAG: TldD/PmbA family protein [Phycisphaerales bacterium]|nr:TldD/PmbA family protein [Phycisphaerales bacterium]